MDALAPFRPGFAEDLAGDSARALHRWTEEIAPRVHRVVGFDPDLCLRLSLELDERQAERDRSRRGIMPPNVLHGAGFALDAVGLGEALDPWLDTVLRPLASGLFPDFGGASLDGSYAFVADYGGLDDDRLDFHVDDSEVTLNLCLDGDFEGSELYFRGQRCAAHRQSPLVPGEAFEVDHRPGTAILHAGRHRHGVHPIRYGTRRSLIMWLSSSTYRADPLTGRCASWCGAWSGPGEP